MINPYMWCSRPQPSGWQCVRRSHLDDTPCACVRDNVCSEVSKEEPKEGAQAYYTHGGIEAWEVIRAWSLNFFLGNVIKYICRAGHKTADPLPDLEKAAANLREEIEAIKKARAG